MAGEDLYAVLGLTPDATSQEIRAAYQRLTADPSALQPARRQLVEEAYDTLGDPIRRLRYDAQATTPAAPRIQMPGGPLPRRSFRLGRPALPPFAIFQRPLPQIDPLLGILVALLIGVAVLVLFSPLLRSKSKSNTPPAQSVADLVTSPTASPTSSVIARGASVPPPGLPAIGGTPGAGIPGLPTIGAGAPGAAIPGLPSGTTVAGATGLGVPPFVSGRLVQDALRAVVAAAAVRNGPSTGAAPVAANPVTPALPAGITPPVTAAPVTAAIPSSPPVGVAQPPLPANAVGPGVPITSPPPNLPSAAVPPGFVPPPTTAAGAPAASAPVVPVTAAAPVTTPITPVSAPAAAATASPPRTPIPLPPELSGTPQFQPQPAIGAAVRGVEGGNIPAGSAATAAPPAAAPNRIGLPSTLPGGGRPAATQAPNRFGAPPSSGP